MNSPRSPLIDPSTSLCLTCSSSLPPRKPLASPTSPKVKPPLPAGDEIFLTECCRRPICPACVRANPRLVRYNPCLRCLGGVGAVSAAAARSPTYPDGARAKEGGARVNVDGGVRDEDVFVLGDESEDGDEGEDKDDAYGEDGQSGELASTPSGSPPPATPPPAYTDIAPPTSPHFPDSLKSPEQEPPPLSSSSSGPQRYYIQPTDTLVGIALRFHADARTLCRLNGLPPSTLRTTPHLLHTRTFLVLPAGARGPGLASSSSAPSAVNTPSPEDEARRARERAESRFRVLTKEADYRVARAYVVVAGVEDDAADAFREDEVKKAGSFRGAGESLRKRHPASPTQAGSSSLEGRAVDRYLDDEEWEGRQRRAGRGVEVPAFPLLSGAGTGKSRDSGGKKTWWRW
ncbi:hypothetical protein DAEQUDRAFT_762479 [Daedalea quercina L-15889]|uniref:LysM domain-containing protein n=1 Tax=Daedalea quercina L-15889 TaxID=1314783 RepID=A0A165T9V2_9APHY|nr:hypothetical protein DAEQUDRAFT_762479 [Daedalea quercina L-15889]